MAPSKVHDRWAGPIGCGGPAPFHALVAARAEDPHTAHRSAIEWAGGSINYATLDRSANQLAHALLAHGVGRGSVVALHADRHPSTVIGMIAIAKAGAAYAPIDAAERPARRAVILEDAGAVALLHNGAVDIERRDGIAIIDSAAISEEIAAFPNTFFSDPADADGLGYLMFTSGSTGRPRGVAMPHRALANLLAWHARARPGSGARRTLQFCSFGFDFSFHEIFSTLAAGGTLVLAEEVSRRDPVALAHLVATERIERLFLPVSALTNWAEAISVDLEPTALREIITTGEQLRISNALRAVCRRNRVVLHNHYGGTEFQDATVLTLDGNADSWPEHPGIGRPIDNVFVRVLNESLDPVSAGEIGQLFVGGVGLARGYVKWPALTAERFVYDPRDRARLYATGDLGRIAPGGSYENHGRTDDQVKIRGVRVEPGEVEAVLREAPDVAECAVVGRKLFGRMRLLAYVTPRRDAVRMPDTATLSARLAERLPETLVPDAITVLDRMPMTDSGKLDRRALPDPVAFERPLAGPALPPANARERLIANVVRETLGLSDVGVEDNLFDLGADSFSLVALQDRLATALSWRVETMDLFRYPTVRSLADAISGAGPGSAKHAEPVVRRTKRPRMRKGEVAVIGLSGRFPDAPNVDAFWENIAAVRHAARPVAAEDLEQPDNRLAQDPRYVRSAAALENMDAFDAGYFDILPREATLMDPQHRILLELAVHALEDAGYGEPRRRGIVGVFAGASSSTYMINRVAPHFGYGAERPFVEADLAQFQAKLGNDRNYLTARLAYKLGLKGPALSVQTACSTSLVAVHLACSSLLDGECDMALAGGISLIVPQRAGYLYEPGMIRSPDGLCRPFDAAANGTFFSNGGGLAVLKRLEDAVRDRDDVRAVVLGSAVNNDGAHKVGFTAPSLERQVDVVETALARAEVESRTLGYVEAHGTGTAMGDPIEVAALTEAFLADPETAPEAGSCSLGAVKANIGHLDEAAGIAGFIKTVEALRHRIRPGTPHFNTPNPDLPFAGSPFVVHRESRPWPAGCVPRRAGVSAFGMGGVNCHVVLQEAPEPLKQAQLQAERPVHVLTASAQNDAALEEVVARHLAVLATLPSVDLADYCFTANTGRRHWPLRVAASGATPAAMAASLSANRRKMVADKETESAALGGVCFMAPGQGSHSPGAARILYEVFPAFRQAIDACDKVLAGRIDRSIRTLLCEEDGAEWLAQTRYQQPALFALGYGYAHLWTSLGVGPEMVLGQSLGEYVAACLSGRLTLEEALSLVEARGRIMAEHALPGRMAAIALPSEEVDALLAEGEPELAVAAYNGPRQIVVAGPPKAVEGFVRAMRNRNTAASLLAVEQGFHSITVNPALAPFGQVVNAVPQGPGSLSMVSTLTGSMLPDEPLAADHWLDHMRMPVRFADALAAARRAGATVFVELGARPVLSHLAHRVFDGSPGPLILGSDGDAPLASLADALARYYSRGGDVDWAAFDAPWPRRRRPVPTYPFQRKRFLLESPAPRRRSESEESSTAATCHPLLGFPLSMPGLAGERRYQSLVEPHRLSWLDGHRIFGVPVMPAVGFLETMIAAARAEVPEEDFSLADFVVHRSMAWAGRDAGRLMHVVVAPPRDEKRMVSLYSRSEEDGKDWTLHATACLEPAPGMPGTPCVGPAEAFEAPATSGTRFVMGDRVLAAEHERRIDLGPEFAVIDTVRVEPGIGVARIAAPAILPAEESNYHVHPVLLEAGYLTLTAIYPELRGRQSYVPFGIGRVWVAAPKRARAGVVQETQLRWCRACLRPYKDGSAAADPEVLTADITLFDGDGRCMVAFDGASVKIASPERMLTPQRRGHAGADAAPLQSKVCAAAIPLYRPILVQQDGPARPCLASGPAKEPAKGPWVVVAGAAVRRRFGAELSQRLPGCELLPADSSEGLLNGLRRRLADGSVAGILDARGLSPNLARSPDPAGQAVEMAGSTPALLDLASRAPGTPPLVFAALGALPDQGRRTGILANGWLPGFVRALAVERPDCASLLIDLEPEIDPSNLADILGRELAAVDAAAPPCGRFVAWRGGVRHIEQLVALSGTLGAGAAALRADRTYVVSGGTGGVGRFLVPFLLDAGAGHVLVLARGARDGPTFDTARVSLHAVDVADRQALETVLARARRAQSLPPVGGVFHLAGVLDDGAIDRLDAARVAHVMAPKARGAWALHCATLEEPVEHFILFSSASATVGAAGQTSYAAANSFLDVLAEHRRAHGLPALSIAWPSWDGVGMAADHDVAARLALRGEGVISPDRALAGLADWLARPPADACLAPLPFDWQKLAQTLLRTPEFLPSLYAQEGLASPDEEEGGGSELRRILVDKRLEWLEDQILARLEGILGIEGPHERDAGFFELGLDSVSSIELRNWLNQYLGISLSQTATFDNPTVTRLATAILEMSGLGHGSTAEAAPAGEEVATGASPSPEAEDRAEDYARRLAERLQQAISDDD